MRPVFNGKGRQQPVGYGTSGVRATVLYFLVPLWGQAHYALLYCSYVQFVRMSCKDNKATGPSDVSPLKTRSGEITGIPGEQSWINRVGARAQMYAAGFKTDDFGKPIVTVAAPYLSYHMCNQKFRELADEIGGKQERNQDDS